MKTLLRVVALALGVLVPAASAWAESETVGDWTAECDATRSCTAVAFGVGGPAAGGSGYRLRISRLAGEGAAWSIRFLLESAPQPMPKGEMRFSIDGANPVSFHEDFGGYLRDHDGVTFGLAGGPDLNKLFGTLRNGQRLELAYEAAEGRTQVAFPLTGLAAALLWIDKKQSRVGASQDVGYPSGVDGEARFTVS